MNGDISHILDEIAALKFHEKLKLVELILHNLNSSPQQYYLDWNNLYGLGKDIWQDEDAQEFVNNFREDR